MIECPNNLFGCFVNLDLHFPEKSKASLCPIHRRSFITFLSHTPHEFNPVDPLISFAFLKEWSECLSIYFTIEDCGWQSLKASSALNHLREIWISLFLLTNWGQPYILLA